VTVEVTLDDRGAAIRAEVKTLDRTGVEMEALTAASAAALTIYDMVKSVDRGMVIESVQLEHKSGGRTGTWERGAS
jgi:cyclic pyranopterin phosphate synthase